jgi:type III secretion system YscQ/HrcQ family protein
MLSACPRVTGREVRAIRATLPVVADLPEEWTWDVPSLGRATGTIVGVGQAVGDIGKGAIGFVLSCGPQPGRLSLDGAFASRLIDMALSGRRSRSNSRPFGPAERGVLVVLLGRAFEIAGWPVRLGPLPPLYPFAPIAVRLAVPGAGTGIVRIDLPEGATVSSTAASESRRGRLHRLPVVARAEIAATSLLGSEVGSLSVGDVVVFEGMPPLIASNAEWDTRLVVGRDVGQLVASVRVAPNGVGTVVEGFTREVQRMGVQRMEEGKVDSAKMAALAAVPVDVVAELGRITLRGDEVLGLSPGAVLPLGVRGRQVTLRVGGEAWAEAEIVEVDGELGVRVTKLMAR